MKESSLAPGLAEPAAPVELKAPQPSAGTDLVPVESAQEESPATVAAAPVPPPPPAQPAKAASDASREPVGAVMTVVEHLDELRQRLMRCLLYIALAFVGALFLTKPILGILEAQASGITIVALTMEEPVLVFVKVAMYTGIALASPLVLLEISRFVAPGLTKKERKVLTPIVVGSPLLFVCGVVFAYFCLLPPMLHFFRSFGEGIAPINQRLDFYISLVSSLLLYMGLCFQLPIILFALSFTGLVNSRMLLSIWKYALVGISLIAAVITPDPTAMSMIIVMAALMTLYFLSILLLKLFGK